MFREVVIGPCRLINADMSYLRDIAGGLGHVAIVTDPPYGIGENNKKNLSRQNAAASIDYGNFEWDQKPATAEQIDMMRSVSSWQIIFGGNYFALPPSKCWLIWDKLNTGDFADCELAWTNLDKAVRLIRFMWNGMLRDEKGTRIHPTQKPVGVMRWCIEKLPMDQVDVIVDPFAGSFSTGVAAMRMGLNFIGIEKDSAMFEKAVKRLSDEWVLKCSELPFEKPEPAKQLAMFGDDEPHN